MKQLKTILAMTCALALNVALATETEVVSATLPHLRFRARRHAVQAMPYPQCGAFALCRPHRDLETVRARSAHGAYRANC